jgi:hypothetical protein
MYTESDAYKQSLLQLCYATVLSCVQILAGCADPGAADVTAAEAAAAVDAEAAAAVDAEAAVYVEPNRAASVVASPGVNQVRASIFLHLSCWRWQSVFRIVLCGVPTFPTVSLIVLFSVFVSRARKNIPPLPRTT